MLRRTLHHFGQRPYIYNAIQETVGSEGMWQNFIKHSTQWLDLTNWTSTDIWLDLGCGTAEVLNHLPKDIHYLGIDSNPKYIAYARQEYSNRPHSTFVCADWNSTEWHSHIETKTIRVITLLGLLHHLSDEDSYKVLELGTTLLKSKGCLITVDGCHEPNASLLEQFFYAIDRGRYVRSSLELRELFPKSIEPKIDIYTNWLRVPYRYALCHVFKS